MKKRLHFFALAMLCLITANAQTPNWKWLQVGSGTSVSGNTIATDANGNSYVAGNFQISISFSTKSLSALKANSIYIAKYDNTGKMLWIKQADNTKYGTINATGIAIDGSGNCYVSGTFNYTVIFDTTHLSTTGSGNVTTDAFIAKYDKDGNFVWVQQPAHGSLYSYNYAAVGITVDPNNMVTVAGTGSGKINYGNGVSFTGGFNGSFMVQYDANGKAQWAKGYWDKDDVGYTSNSSIASDKDGNLFLSGYANGQQTDLGNSSTYNMSGGYYVSKYDKKGGFIWAKTVTGPQATAISVDGSGNPAITGYFKGTTDFNGTSVTTYGDYDIFVAKYDKDGALKWVKQAGSTGADKSANSIIQDGSGNVYISGDATPSAKFDSKSIPGGTKLPGFGYVAKYDNSGSIQWLQNVDIKGGGTYFSNYTYVYDIALDASGNVYTTGNTAPYTMFGTMESGGYGTFIAQIGSGTAPTPPAAPSNLTAAAHKKKNDGKIQLGWTDNSTNETGFIINRSTDNTNWTAIDTTAANVVTYLDSNLVNSTKFYYKVTAYNSTGSSAASNVVDATTFESAIEIDVNPENLLIYPNPSCGNFSVQFPKTGIKALISIHNILGQLIYEKSMENTDGICNIQLPDQTKGMLIIGIQINKKVYQLRHLVQ